MWTLDNWRAKRGAVTCCDFSGKSNCMAIDHATGKYCVVCFGPKGFLTLSQPISVPWPLSAPPIRPAGVCNPPKSPSGPMQHKYLPLNLQASLVSCCVLFSPCVPLPCVFCTAAEDPATGGSSNPSGWWVWSRKALGALAPRGEFWSMLLRSIKETG